MPRRYDIESYVEDVIAMLKTKLDAAVAAVEAEQVAAGLPAAFTAPDTGAIQSDAYFAYSWHDGALNKPRGVALFPTRVPERGLGPDALERYTLDVGVYLCGTQNDPLATRKALRYTKALVRVFQENWGDIGQGIAREALESQEPLDFKLNVNSSDDCKIAGVSLSFTLG